MKLYNSLTKKVETFRPIDGQSVSMYTCGPTVYNFATIGNFRTYTNSDLLVRALKYLGYNVHFVMNLTDVGHLTGDNEGDADQGEDRLEKSAKSEGKTAWDVAEYYTEAFLKDFEKLNLTKPQLFAKATDHIPEQIALIQALYDKGFTYTTSDGLYFDTVKFETQTKKVYGELSSLDQIKEGARVEPNPEKRDPRDFALWKFSYAGGRNFDETKDDASLRRHMEWESPWGLGFPGWHIECSAMCMKYLGETIDIHVGGEDLRATHHPNEIAQSEAATGKQFVRFWVHSAFLKVDGKRMGKSLGNAFTVSDVVGRGFNPLSLRYFYLTGHYKSQLNFTWDALTGAQNALNKLFDVYDGLLLGEKDDTHRTTLSEEKAQKVEKLTSDFRNAIENDLNMPQALAVLWECVKSNIPTPDKKDLLLSFDEVFGFGLSSRVVGTHDVPEAIIELLKERDAARLARDFKKADSARQKILDAGYQVLDSDSHSTVKKIG